MNTNVNYYISAFDKNGKRLASNILNNAHDDKEIKANSESLKKIDGVEVIEVSTAEDYIAYLNGKIRDTHEDYPEAMRWLAAKENVPLIDLNEMTRTLYEAMGVEPSKKAFVHYPAGTYPGQNRVLADNTHFNPYGAYQISKCIIEGIKKAGLPISNYLRSDYSGYNPAHPDALDSFKWNDSPFTEIEKPDGN